MVTSKTANPQIPVLDEAGVLASLRALRMRQPVQFDAFYSSQLGGIVTDPALMVLPFDDHMVHRGHGIFDTAAIVGGRIYDLEAHLDRFLGSAERSRYGLMILSIKRAEGVRRFTPSVMRLASISCVSSHLGSHKLSIPIRI